MDGQLLNAGEDGGLQRTSWGLEEKQSPAGEEKRNEQVKNVSACRLLVGRQRRQPHVGGKHGQKAEQPLPEDLKGFERNSKPLGFLSVSHSEPWSTMICSVFPGVLGIEGNHKNN